MAMRLWLISQTENDGYDTYDSAVVAAETEDAARNTMPGPYEKFGKPYGAWCSGPNKVEVKLLGDALPEITAGVVCASYNAG